MVREVVLTLRGLTWHKLYDLYAQPKRRNGSERTNTCGKGTAYKIKSLLESGNLEFYLEYLASIGVLSSGDETAQAPDSEIPCPEPILTQFNALDELMGGMDPGELVILAGKRSTGKSILAQNVMGLVSQRGYKVGFVALETGQAHVDTNLLGSTSSVDIHRLRLGLYTEREKQRLIDSIDALSSMPLLYIPTDDASIGGIQNSAIELSKEHHLDLIVVDYIQLIEDYPTDETASGEVSRVAKRLKSLAKKLDLPVLALYQVGQDVRTVLPQEPEVPCEIPIPSSLAGNADQVLLLYRDDRDYPEEEWEQCFPSKPYPRDIVSISLVRNRRGPIGHVKLRIREHLARLESLAQTDNF